MKNLTGCQTTESVSEKSVDLPLSKALNFLRRTNAPPLILIGHRPVIPDCRDFHSFPSYARGPG